MPNFFIKCFRLPKLDETTKLLLKICEHFLNISRKSYKYHFNVKITVL